MKPLAAALLLAGCSAPTPEREEQPSSTAVADHASATPSAGDAGTPVEEVQRPADPAATTAAGPAAADSAGAADPGSADAAVAVVRRYLRALAGDDRAAAAREWDVNEAPTETNPARFAQRFAGAGATIGSPGRIDSGAGQRYVEVPIRVAERAGDGAAMRDMTVVLHRSGDIDGATAADRTWHIRDIRPAGN